jgi:glyoxylase-like metal-dependent hydrolase (beta-lactamase superfamily II)
MSHFATLVSKSLLALAVAAALSACSPRTDDAAQAPAETTTEPAAATATAPASEDAKAFSIGALSAFALRDGALEFPNDNQVFGVGRTPEEVAAVLSAAGAPSDKIQLSVQPLLVKSSERVLLFDTGAASNFGPTAGKLPASLAAAGMDAASVTDVFISHAHGDHIGGLVDAAGKLSFPNATVHISAPEWEFLGKLDAEKAKAFGIGNHAALVAAVTPKLDAFAPATELVPGTVKAVAIKGHTPGHSGYLVGSGSDTLLYIGDAMHSHIVSVQKPEWINAFDGGGDTAVAATSRRNLLEQNAANGQRIYAVHFPFPGVGKFQKQGEGYVWAAE